MAGLAGIKNMFEHVMEAFVCNKISDYYSYFNDASMIEYSTLGKHSGTDCIIKALTLQNEFDIHYSTLSNLMEFESETDYILLAKGHHFLACQDGAFLFPLLFGGKYEFAVNKSTSKISHIKFYLEYEFGNTYLAKHDLGWKLYEETKDMKTAIVGGYQSYLETGPETDKTHIQKTIYKFLWDFDNMDYEACMKRITEDIYIRVKLFEEVGPSKEYYKKEEFKQLMEDHLAYEDQAHISICYEDINIDGSKALIHVKRYNPSKTVNKHIDVSTMHKVFFNMRFAIRMVKDNKDWLIEEVNITPINDVDPVGFNFVEVRDNKLNSAQSAFYR